MNRGKSQCKKYEEAWEEQYEELKKYLDQHEKGQPTRLDAWIKVQRNNLAPQKEGRTKRIRPNHHLNKLGSEKTRA